MDSSIKKHSHQSAKVLQLAQSRTKNESLQNMQERKSVVTFTFGVHLIAVMAEDMKHHTLFFKIKIAQNLFVQILSFGYQLGLTNDST